MSEQRQDIRPSRLRPRPGLLPFPFTGEINVMCCRTDKLELSINGTLSSASPDSTRDTLRLYSAGQGGVVHPVLNVPRGRNRLTQSINSHKWLFGGKIIYGRAYDRVCPVTIQLSLNPTRFAEHCRRIFNPRSIDELRLLAFSELLRKRSRVVRAIRAETLDGNDNYFVGTAWLTHVSGRWAEFVDFYVAAVCHVIQEDFNRNSRVQNPFEPPIMRFQSPHDTCPSIGYVEQHIEYQVADAYRDYRYIEERISEAAPNISISVLQRFGREGSARWHECWLAKGVKLKIYAKSVDRIRVEIEYHGASVGGDRSLCQLVQNRLWSSAHSFMEKIQALQQDAADRLQLVASHLAQPTNDCVPSIDLLLKLIVYFRASKFSSVDVAAFLGELFEFGHVGGSENSPARRIAEALQRQDLFEPISIVQRNNHRRFRPVAGLREALGALREARAPMVAALG